MALTLFWRCEGTALDATHDFSAADTSAAASGSPSLDAAAARTGTLGILTDAGANSQYRFNPASIVRADRGCMGLSIRLSDLGASVATWLRCSNGAGNGEINMRITETGAVVGRIFAGAGLSQEIHTPDVIVPDQWWGLVFRWQHSIQFRQVEAWNEAGELIAQVRNRYPFHQASDIDDLASGLRIGPSGAEGIVAHIDNVMWADDYDEPLHRNFAISSFTEYQSTPESVNPLIGGASL